mgnify:CR=1 FL=1
MSFPDPAKSKLKLSAASKDLISKMLEKNKDKRIGAKGGMDEIFSHPFFKEVDFVKMINKELKPPYMPTINDNELKYFDPKLQQHSLDSSDLMS